MSGTGLVNFDEKHTVSWLWRLLLQTYYEDMYYDRKTSKILVLGSGGQVGAYLTDYLRRMGNEVLEFDITNGSEQDMTIIPNGQLEKPKIS